MQKHLQVLLHELALVSTSWCCWAKHHRCARLAGHAPFAHQASSLRLRRLPEPVLRQSCVVLLLPCFCTFHACGLLPIPTAAGAPPPPPVLFDNPPRAYVPFRLSSCRHSLDGEATELRL